MQHLRIFVSEFGNAPYACAHRYNALLELFLENKDPIKLSVVTSLENAQAILSYLKILDIEYELQRRSLVLEF